MRLPFRGSVSRDRLEQLLIAPPEDFDTCNTLARKLQNHLTQKREHMLQLSPLELLDMLSRTPEREEREIHRLLKMFLAMFLIYREGKAIYKGKAHTVEQLAAARPSKIWRRSSGDTALICRYFLEEEARGGETPHLAFLRGSLAYKMNHFADAFDAFDRGRLMFKAGARAYHHYRGAYSIRPLPEFRKAVEQGQDPVRDFTMEEGGTFPNERPIIVIGLDQLYYERYAARWVERAEGRVNLHFHVANPDPARLHRAPCIRYSFETCPTGNAAYYATMRFLQLHHLLEHYQRPVIVSDADAYLEGDPTVLLDETHSYDIAVTETGPLRNHLPWRHLNAQVFMARPTAETEAFLAAFRRLFAHLEADGGAQWWVDQALLSTSKILLQEQNHDLRMRCGRLWASSGLRQSKLE